MEELKVRVPLVDPIQLPLLVQQSQAMTPCQVLCMELQLLQLAVLGFSRQPLGLGHGHCPAGALVVLLEGLDSSQGLQPALAMEVAPLEAGDGHSERAQLLGGRFLWPLCCRGSISSSSSRQAAAAAATVQAWPCWHTDSGVVGRGELQQL